MTVGERVAHAFRYVTGIGLERNLGGADRYLRLALGLALLVLAVSTAIGSRAVGAASLLATLFAGGYLVWEAARNYCPLNRAVGQNTYEES